MLLARLAIPLTAAAVAIPLASSAQALSFEQFQSPSGNLSCGMGVLDDGKAFAQCEIIDRDWTSPPRPADCPLDYGDRIGLQQGSPATFGCHGDTLRGPDLPALGYGQSRSAGPITCLSRTSGMTCTDSSTGHFFTLSRESYKIG
jgi:hypothetical protein